MNMDGSEHGLEKVSFTHRTGIRAVRPVYSKDYFGVTQQVFHEANSSIRLLHTVGASRLFRMIGHCDICDNSLDGLM